MSKDSAARNSADVAADDHAVILDLLSDALRLLDRDQGSARRRIEQAYGLACRSGRAAPQARGALAAWQARRVEAYVGENLGSCLRIEAAAAVVGLSASYFSRAFKATFGAPFSNYVIQRRIELAKRLLLTTEETIADIALACGLADQSHLTRLFSRSVGSPPNAWRRSMRDAAMDLQAAA